MPAMIRPKGKATKIAFNLIGTPANLRKKRGRKKQKMTDIELQITANDRSY